MSNAPVRSTKEKGGKGRRRKKISESPFGRFAIGGIRLKPNHEKEKKEKIGKQNRKNV